MAAELPPRAAGCVRDKQSQSPAAGQLEARTKACAPRPYRNGFPLESRRCQKQVQRRVKAAELTITPLETLGNTAKQH